MNTFLWGELNLLRDSLILEENTMYEVEDGHILIPIDCITAKLTRDDDY